MLYGVSTVPPAATYAFGSARWYSNVSFAVGGARAATSASVWTRAISTKQIRGKRATGSGAPGAERRHARTPSATPPSMAATATVGRYRWATPRANQAIDQVPAPTSARLARSRARDSAPLAGLAAHARTTRSPTPNQARTSDVATTRPPRDAPQPAASKTGPRASEASSAPRSSR